MPRAGLVSAAFTALCQGAGAGFVLLMRVFLPDQKHNSAGALQAGPVEQGGSRASASFQPPIQAFWFSSSTSGLQLPRSTHGAGDILSGILQDTGGARDTSLPSVTTVLC